MELKPCPFCGCLAWMHAHQFDDGKAAYRVECEGRCGAMTTNWHTEPEAVAHWNMRADQPAAATDDREEFLDLLGRYWDLAYTEGKEGRTCDTENCDAQRTIDEIMDRYDRRAADNSPAAHEPTP